MAKKNRQRGDNPIGWIIGGSLAGGALFLAALYYVDMLMRAPG